MLEQIIRQIYVENTQILFINYLSYVILFTGILTYYYYHDFVTSKRGKKLQDLRNYSDDLKNNGLTKKEMRDDQLYVELEDDLYRTRREFQYQELGAAFLVAIFGSLIALAPAACFLEGVVAYLVNS